MGLKGLCQEKLCTRQAQIRFVKLDRDGADKIGAVAFCNGHAVAFMRHQVQVMDPTGKVPAFVVPSAPEAVGGDQ